MYVGRFVVVGKTRGRMWAGYRVSSRSFPDRHAAKLNDSMAAIMPNDLKDLEKSPYLFYICIKLLPGAAVLSNGSHTESIAEKIGVGYPVKDALASVLLAMDYEKTLLARPG